MNEGDKELLVEFCNVLQQRINIKTGWGKKQLYALIQELILQYNTVDARPLLHRKAGLTREQSKELLRLEKEAND